MVVPNGKNLINSLLCTDKLNGTLFALFRFQVYLIANDDSHSVTIFHLKYGIKSMNGILLYDMFSCSTAFFAIVSTISFGWILDLHKMYNLIKVALLVKTIVPDFYIVRILTHLRHSYSHLLSPWIWKHKWYREYSERYRLNALRSQFLFILQLLEICAINDMGDTAKVTSLMP